MINPRHRWILPGAELAGALAYSAIGIFVLLVGVILSFRAVARQWLSEFSLAWTSFISDRIGPQNVSSTNHLLGGLLLLSGIVLTAIGVRQVFRHFVKTLNPGLTGSVATNYFRRQQLARGPKIVVLGGGTGLSTLLRGLKRHSSNITAIVTVTDDGGSSGRLSEELGIIPPGDIRNCLVALADSEKQLTDLFQYRFRGKSGSLSGHSLGNLLIAALIDINDGDFERALNMASEVLTIRGRVIPSTLERVRLRALLDDGREAKGETNIVHAGGRIRRIFLEPADAHVYPDAIRAIEDADLILIGPGSVYSSVIPNLLVPGIGAAFRQSRAPKVYICNVMTQPGESDSFTAAEHVLAIEANVEDRLFDTVMVNSQLPSSSALEKYRQEDQFPVEPDVDRIKSMGFKVVLGDFMSESDFVRHDPIKLAEQIMGVLRR